MSLRITRCENPDESNACPSEESISPTIHIVNGRNSSSSTNEVWNWLFEKRYQQLKKN